MAAGKSDTEQSVSDLPAEARKQLDGLMLKRAVAAIERGNAINRELENVRAMQSNGLLTPAGAVHPAGHQGGGAGAQRHQGGGQHHEAQLGRHHIQTSVRHVSQRA